MSARYLVLNRLCGHAVYKYLRENGTEIYLKAEPKLLVILFEIYVDESKLQKIKNKTNLQCIYIVIRNGHSKVNLIAARNYEEIFNDLEIQKGAAALFSGSCSKVSLGRSQLKNTR